jgi:iron complex outermembrane recepter protein
MKQKKSRSVNHSLCKTAIWPTTILTLGLAAPAFAQNTGAPVAKAPKDDEVVVTARRMEENIQEVPISITVFNQDMLDERNVVSGADLVAYTPSLSVNTRFGSDQASFAIRGFTQELRTTASVGVFFADVVAPRGGGSITSGDGAGPGSFFDLQNVQVLKGPQGTLFGRNTTGGAILLVPQVPTDKLEGYLEESAGNYNMRRTQGVINVPLSDMARARFGVDALKRDGYVKNVSGIGPDRFSDINYIAGRASLMLDLTDSIQNYTIFSYTNSENNGSLQGMFACNTGVNLSSACEPVLAHQGSNFYTVENDTEDPVSKLMQSQLINTTTWDVNDDFRVKNILSYADLNQTMRTAVFGSNFQIPDTLPVYGGQHFSFFPSYQYPGIPTNSQTTFVEELQFQGTGLDKKLTWQAGLYYENSKPDGLSGSNAPSLITCPQPLGRDPAQWGCMDILGGLAPAGSGFSGSVQSNIGKIEYLNQAVYSQVTYDISDEFKITGGLRYTVDETKTTSQQILYSEFPTPVIPLTDPQPAPGGPGNIQCVIGGALRPDCKYHQKQRSEAPTWLIDFDYLPTPDVLIYAKYARGYRQGSINMFGPEGIQAFDPEKVNSYEIGAKTSFHSFVSGTFNTAIFYNELSDQQLQANYVPVLGTPGAATTAILNAGSSTIQGVEAETTLKLLDDLTFNLSYTYLETHLDSLTQPSLYPNSLITYQQPVAAAEEGGHLSFSPRHSVTTGLNYRLPLSAEVGDVSLGAVYTFVSSQVSTDAQPYGTLPSHRLLNLNMGWKAIAGSGFDAALFMTNALNEKITNYVPGLYTQGGMEFRVVGEPRMWGARVKYNFGL